MDSNRGKNISTFLSNNSYIKFEYKYEEEKLNYKEISFSQQTSQFGGCNGSLIVPPNLTVSDVKIISYSGGWWTDRLSIDNKRNNKNLTYNLSEYGNNYELLGDPYVIHVPITYIQSNDSNNFSIRLGVNPINGSKTCSTKDKAIYVIRIEAFGSSQGIFPDCFGANVTVYYDTNSDGVSDGFVYVPIGSDLPGFDKTPIDVDELNTSGNGISNAFVTLLEKLNFYISATNSNIAGTQTNPIDIQITPDIEFHINIIGGIPFMWGPAKMEVIIWRKE